ncbi:hypothetical protein [Mesorhizobium sangaii]|uniref:Uncharacterized protein n=1 Tax=Mesorhizobium sangaii TaxID=505389 RepID=A0A841PM51_9HYPH|nr:hypothetical protein [Mesorhizobium sangaii]MBB6413748.1 hypothetical protein [Mesorhizobium sangaii]
MTHGRYVPVTAERQNGLLELVDDNKHLPLGHDSTQCCEARKEFFHEKKEGEEQSVYHGVVCILPWNELPLCSVW